MSFITRPLMKTWGNDMFFPSMWKASKERSHVLQDNRGNNCTTSHVHDRSRMLLEVKMMPNFHVIGFPTIQWSKGFDIGTNHRIIMACLVKLWIHQGKFRRGGGGIANSLYVGMRQIHTPTFSYGAICISIRLGIHELTTAFDRLTHRVKSIISESTTRVWHEVSLIRLFLSISIKFIGSIF